MRPAFTWKLTYNKDCDDFHLHLLTYSEKVPCQAIFLMAEVAEKGKTLDNVLDTGIFKPEAYYTPALAEAGFGEHGMVPTIGTISDCMVFLVETFDLDPGLFGFLDGTDERLKRHWEAALQKFSETGELTPSSKAAGFEVLYFEAHVTVEPVFDERLEQLKSIALEHGFRVADLLMKKRREDTPERSQYDTFCTGISKSFADLDVRTKALVEALPSAGFSVWRWKIEGALFDHRRSVES